MPMQFDMARSSQGDIQGDIQKLVPVSQDVWNWSCNDHGHNSGEHSEPGTDFIAKMTFDIKLIPLICKLR